MTTVTSLPISLPYREVMKPGVYSVGEGNLCKSAWGIEESLVRLIDPRNNKGLFLKN